LAWHPTKYQIAIGFVSVCIIDVQTGDVIEMHGHTKCVKDICWSPDGKRVLSAGFDGAFVWDVERRQGHRIFPHVSSVSSVAWCPDNVTVALAHGGKVSILSVDDWQELRIYSGNGSRVISLAWHPFRFNLMACAGENVIFLWDTSTCQCLEYFRSSSREVKCVRWSPSGNEIVSSAEDGCVSIWKIPACEIGKQVMFCCHSDEVTSVVWNPTYSNGHVLASVSRDGSFVLWDVDAAEPICFLEEKEGTDAESVVKLELVSWSRDSSRLASSGEDCLIRIWDAREGSVLMTLRGHRKKIMDMTWGSCVSTLVSVSLDGTARVWNVLTGDEVATLLQSPEIDLGLSLAWSLAGDQLAVGCRSQYSAYVHIFETRKDCPHEHCLYTSFVETHRLHMAGDTVSPDSLAWSPDASRLAAAYLNEVLVWDSHTWEALFTIQSTQVSLALSCLRWSGDNLHLAAGGIAGMLYIWRVTSNAAVLVKCLNGHLANNVTGVDWSPDGQRLVSVARDSHVMVWDLFLDSR
jgi:WD40 repeat protein